MHYVVRDMHRVMTNLNLTLHYIAQDVVTDASLDANILLKQLQRTDIYPSEDIRTLRELLNRIRHRPSERWSWKLICQGYNALKTLLSPIRPPLSIILHLDALKLDVNQIIRDYCCVVFNPRKCLQVLSPTSHIGLICQSISHIPQNFELTSDDVHTLGQPVRVQDLIDVKWKFSTQPMKIISLEGIRRVYVPRCINWCRNELIVMYHDQLLALDASTRFVILKQPPHIIHAV